MDPVKMTIGVFELTVALAPLNELQHVSIETTGNGYLLTATEARHLAGYLILAAYEVDRSIE
jgi:hypothetical protein